MELKIRFKRPLPEDLEKGILHNSEAFDNFTVEDEYYELLLNRKELKKKLKRFTGLYDRLRNLGNTSVSVNGFLTDEITLEEILDSIRYEREFGDSNMRNHDWGHKDLEDFLPISTEVVSPRHWYDYGSFRDGKWIIDKEKIKRVLLARTDLLGLDENENFRVLDITDDLARKIPNSIDPNTDRDWEFIYSNRDAGSYELRQVIGVAPVNEKKEDHDSSSFNNPLDSLMNNLMGDLTDSLGSGDFHLDDLFSSFTGGTSTKAKTQRNIPNTTFNDIGGMDSIIEQVREVIELPVLSPELLDYYKIKPHKGILLYGPPGCGKTLLAKAVANEINAHFIPISGPEILNKYYGQSEENLRNIFDEAKRMEPAIIYFDEFDAIATKRNEDLDPLNARIVNQILTLLDGVGGESKVCILASTNRLDMIDEAVKRPGRFDYVIEVERPTLQGCRQIFDIYTKEMPVDKTFDKEDFIKTHLHGLTGAEIAFIATEAAYNSIRRTVDLGGLYRGNRFRVNPENIIIDEDFYKAYDKLNKTRQKNKKI